jgi:hypothetical protein
MIKGNLRTGDTRVNLLIHGTASTMQRNIDVLKNLKNLPGFHSDLVLETIGILEAIQRQLPGDPWPLPPSPNFTLDPKWASKTPKQIVKDVDDFFKEVVKEPLKVSEQSEVFGFKQKEEGDKEQ